MIYLVSLAVFLGLVFLLVGILLLVESRVVVKGLRTIVINDDADKAVRTSGGKTLLSTLLENDILIPCACGGKGTCGTCKTVVTAGGGEILPTELSLVSRRERVGGVRLACQLKVKQDLKIRVPEEIFNVRKYTATVVGNQNVATFIKELVLKLDPGQPLDFRAGAYMQIDIPRYRVSFRDFDVSERFKPAWDRFRLWGLNAANPESDNRAYSLANPPYETGILKFTIRIATPPPQAAEAPPGVGSSYAFQLKPGDRVTLSGPYGEFYALDTDREMCFIGGGAGMAPMRSHILHQLVTVKTDRRISFWYGARSSQEMFYDDEFRQLEAQHPNFTYHVALSDPQPEDHWEGMTGFIHRCLYDHYLSGHPDPSEIEYYICGPPVMLQALLEMLDGLGVERDTIFFDDFGG